MQRSEELNAKRERLRGWLERCGHGAILLSSPSAFAWYTCGARNDVVVDRGAASLLVTAERTYLLSNNIEMPRLLEEEVPGLDVEPVEWTWHDGDGEGRAVERLGEAGRTVSDEGALGLPRPSRPLMTLRYPLLPPEIDRYRRLGADAAAAVEETCRRSAPGATEREIAARLAFECRRRDVVPLVVLVAADERIGRYRHPLPTAQRLEGTLMVVLTGWRGGLHASLTRLTAFGRVAEELRARHRAVMTVDAALLGGSRPGRALREVLCDGVRAYAETGFADEWQRHHQGGITGYAGREAFATPAAGERLEAGHAVAWNPSIAGTKSEDTALVTDDGPELLTRSGAWPEAPMTAAAATVPRPLILERSAP